MCQFTFKGCILSPIFIKINTIVKTWGVVARTCCIELISFIQSLISFIRLLFSFAPKLVSFIRRLFSFAQTAADIDSWLLWIGGGGAWRRSRDVREGGFLGGKSQKLAKVFFCISFICTLAPIKRRGLEPPEEELRICYISGCKKSKVVKRRQKSSNVAKSRQKSSNVKSHMSFIHPSLPPIN